MQIDNNLCDYNDSRVSCMVRPYSLLLEAQRVLLLKHENERKLRHKITTEVYNCLHLHIGMHPNSISLQFIYESTYNSRKMSVQCTLNYKNTPLDLPIDVHW